MNPANFPSVAGDAMAKSRSNYYRVPGSYTKKPDGSLYLTEGGWGGSMVNSQLKLIKPRTNSSTPETPWDITAQTERANGYFRLYTNLKLTATNPTNDLAALRNGNSTFPFFNSYPVAADGSLIYNWQAWYYTVPLASGVRFADPKTANNLRNVNNTTYRDYNYLTLRDNNPGNDLTANSADNNFELNISNSATSPLNIFSRINNLRDKLILSLWIGYAPLFATSSKPLTDLRISGWDDTYSMKYKTWFSGISSLAGSGNEYLKIQAANNFFQSQNYAGGDDVRNFNVKFDQVADIAEDMLSGSTEAAVELFGQRTINYNNDVDLYGSQLSTLALKFRLISVGMTYSYAKLVQRNGLNAGTFMNNNGINYFHPNDPFGLSQEHYINIKTSRPAIAFGSTDAEAGNAYLGTPLTMVGGTTGTLTSLTLNITDATDNLLPFQEIETTPLKPTIDPTRVRVSLVKKSDYDAGNPSTNNDLPVVAGFAYLTQDNFIALESTIPTGEYMLKYDYSAPDSKTDIKTEGDKLGEVFAKSIYRPLIVTSGLPVTFGPVDVKFSAGQLLVNWSTASETNNSHFEIEASKDGKSFVKIGEVKSQALNGDSNQIIQYSFSKDLNAAMALLGFSIFSAAFILLLLNRRNKLLFTLMLIGGMSLFGTSCNKLNGDELTDSNGKTWVRIKQVDKDGKFEYSRAVQAVRE